MMTTPQQWLSYWKKSLLDSMKAEIDLEKYKVKIQVPNFSPFSGCIPDLDEVNRLIDAEEKRINKKRHVHSPQDPDWEYVKEVLVLIAPFQLNPLLRRQSFVRERKSLYPFWYSAVLNRSGQLSIPSEIRPFIPRSFLTPIVDERIEYTIGDTETMDLACAVGDIRFKDYSEYIEHILRIFEQVAEAPLSAYLHEDFATDYMAHIIVPDEMIGAATNLIELYQNLSLQEKLPPLLDKFIQLEHKAPRLPLEPPHWLPVNALHLGQMKSGFAISYSQRKSLYTLLANPEEQVIAVNGPPGTGKTTLLQSVVANAMVEGVLSGQPPVILACSANNQAVTNIIDSFTKKDDNEPEVRWLPNLKGYATYLPSSTKPAEALRNINYMKPGGDGLFAQMETREYLAQSKTEYLQQAALFFGETIASVGEVVKRFHERITSSKQLLQEAQIRWMTYLDALKQFKEEYLPTVSTTDPYETDGYLVSKNLLLRDIASLEELTEKVLRYFQHEGFLRKVGCWFGISAAMRNRRSELNVIFRRSILHPSVFPEKISGSADVLIPIDRLIAIAEKLQKNLGHWLQWQQVLEQKHPNRKENFFGHLPSEGTGFYDMLDTTIRHEAFTNAVHYWEGRWIEETEDLLTRPPADQNKRGEEACKARWRRRAMLTPCFVSTFYMAPKFFDYARYLGKGGNGESVFGNPPLTGFIDCLIVDEAGQVPPEVGAGVFALARKAVVVGDVKQIEPVWNILPKVDLGNLKKEELIGTDEKVAEEIYEPKGFLSSSGSIMQMAQNACSFAETGSTERGMMLVEHRRCYNEIIEYCNALAYHGLLRPLRGLAKEDKLYPPMYCIHVEGQSSVRGKERYNDTECEAMSNWLKEQKAAIEAKYIDGKDYKSIEDIVGILTPFVGQKDRLKRHLRQAGFDTDRLKLGTVHALQGAERPIVLFSTVYGPGDVGTMFFDYGNKPNMLNVAVSRAKDSFIVFANSKIFNSKANTPSGILARHLTIKSKN